MVAQKAGQVAKSSILCGKKGWPPSKGQLKLEIIQPSKLEQKYVTLSIGLIRANLYLEDII